MDHNQKQQQQSGMKQEQRQNDSPETLEEMAAQEPANAPSEGKDAAPTFPKAR